MLMIFVGPLISQSMPMDHPMPMGVGMGHEGMSHEHMDHGDMAHAGMPGMGGEEGNRLASDVLWEKCGYCSLLFHSPPLTEDACLALFSVPFATAPAVTFLNEAFVASPVFRRPCAAVPDRLTSFNPIAAASWGTGASSPRR